MRIKAVELYKPHVLGNGKDLEQGINGVPVYPIATGKFAERRMDCKTVVVPADYTSSKVVVAISKFHAAEYEHAKRNRQRGWGRRTPLTRYPKTERERKSAPRTVEQFEEKFGKELTEWEWETMVVNAATLMPADAYNEARFFIEERQAKIDKAEAECIVAGRAALEQAERAKRVLQDELLDLGLTQCFRGHAAALFYRLDGWNRPAPTMVSSRNSTPQPRFGTYNNFDIWRVLEDQTIHGHAVVDGAELAEVMIRRKKALAGSRDYLKDTTVKIPAEQLIGMLLPKQQKRVREAVAQLVDLDQKFHDLAVAHNELVSCAA